jgi:O-antigen ligase/tetratricopeptide (TPR) repeat protein
MEPGKIAFENIEAAQSKFDTVIEWLLGGMLVFMPLLFGARNAWTEEVVIALSGCIVICFLLKLIVDRNQRIVWTWAYVLVGLFVLIILLQLISLPSGLLNNFSPRTVGLRTELLAGLPGVDELLKNQTISLYPNGTKHDLRLILSVAAVFFVVLNVFRRPSQIKRLLMVIALTGGLVALIALAQDVFGNGLRYWFVPHPYAGSSKTLSGPFLNHNHFGQFMNLSIGAAIGWLCATLHADFSGRRIKPDTVVDHLSSPSAKLLWLLVAIIALGAATVFISLTRGGMVSMLIAAVVTMLLLCCRRSLAGSAWIMVLMAFAAFTCILMVGFEAVYDRFATLQNFEGFDFRWQILKDLVVSFEHFPLLGTGMGTHSVVYPMYQSINTILLFTHVENEYAQLLEETGIVGLCLLIIFLIIILSSYLKSIRSTKLPIQSAAYGLGFGLLAILIHSFSDYGQHIPANAFLSAIFCALLIGLARQKKETPETPKAIIPSQKYGRLCTACLLCICGVWLWALVGANNARIAEGHWKEALAIEKGLKTKDWRGTEAEYSELISHTETANRYQPENVRYQYGLNLYRWYSITKAEGDIEAAAIGQESMPAVHNIVNGLNQAIKICPTYGPSYSLAGQIEKFIFYDDAGAEKIRKGFQLAPSDPIACFVAGRLDVLEGNPEDSISKFEKAVNIDGGLFKNIVNIYINYLSRPDLAMSAAGDNVGRLRQVARALEDMQYNDLAKQSRQKAKEVLETRCARPDASAFDLAALAGVYRSQQNNDKAVEYYNRALALDYGQIDWRFALARLLAETDRIPEAMNEARICLRLRPQFKAAERLVTELSVNPASFGEKTD